MRMWFIHESRATRRKLKMLENSSLSQTRFLFRCDEMFFRLLRTPHWWDFQCYSIFQLNTAVLSAPWKFNILDSGALQLVSLSWASIFLLRLLSPRRHNNDVQCHMSVKNSSLWARKMNWICSFFALCALEPVSEVARVKERIINK